MGGGVGGGEGGAKSHSKSSGAGRGGGAASRGSEKAAEGEQSHATSLHTQAQQQPLPGYPCAGAAWWHSLGGSLFAMVVSKQVFTLPLRRASEGGCCAM